MSWKVDPAIGAYLIPIGFGIVVLIAFLLHIMPESRIGRLADQLRLVLSKGPRPDSASAYRNIKNLVHRIGAFEAKGHAKAIVIALRPGQLQVPAGVRYYGEGPPRPVTPEWTVYGLLLRKGFDNTEFIEVITRQYGPILAWWLAEYSNDADQPRISATMRVSGQGVERLPSDPSRAGRGPARASVIAAAAARRGPSAGPRGPFPAAR
jgi:hypothetical protein